MIQLLYAAAPLHSLSSYYEKLIESGVGSFTDLEPIDEHDLLALGMGCDDARAFVLAKRNFDHVLSTPRASDVNIGLDWNERFRNLLWLGFSTPIALPDDWRSSHYLVAAMATIKLVLAVAAHFNMVYFQFNVEGAFLLPKILHIAYVVKAGGKYATVGHFSPLALASCCEV